MMRRAIAACGRARLTGGRAHLASTQAVRVTAAEVLRLLLSLQRRPAIGALSATPQASNRCRGRQQLSRHRAGQRLVPDPARSWTDADPAFGACPLDGPRLWYCRVGPGNFTPVTVCNGSAKPGQMGVTTPVRRQIWFRSKSQLLRPSWSAGTRSWVCLALLGRLQRDAEVTGALADPLFLDAELSELARHSAEQEAGLINSAGARP